MDSQAKGKSFERECADFMSAATGVKWVRSPHSGALATLHSMNHLRGDLMMAVPDQRYADLVIECKSYGKAVLLSDVCNPKSLLHSWIAQAEQEAGMVVTPEGQSYKRTWVLFFKWNRSPMFIAAPTQDMLNYASAPTLATIFKCCEPVTHPLRGWVIFQVRA